MLRAGPDEVGALEDDLERMFGRSAVAVPSARAGLGLALRALGIDDLIVGGLAFEPMIDRLNARVRAVDVAPRSLFPDPEALADVRASALLITHAYGRRAPVELYRAIADRRGIALIEDCAQAIGADVGRLGDVALFSFGPTKPLGAWGGGAVLSDASTAAKMRALRTRTRGGSLRIARGAIFDGWTRRRAYAAWSRAAGLAPRLADAMLAIHHRRTPWHDAELGPIEAALIRARLPELAARTERRRALHAMLRARIPGGWADDGIGWGLLIETDDAHVTARRMRARGIDALAGELGAIGVRAKAMARRLVRLPILDDSSAGELDATARALDPARARIYLRY